MHDESFLREMLNMSIVQKVMTSDYFAICFEFNKHVVDMHKTLLDWVPLGFNSSLLFYSLFDAYMQQCFDVFSEHVNSRVWHAWDTTLKNINDIHRMYGLTNAKDIHNWLMSFHIFLHNAMYYWWIIHMMNNFCIFTFNYKTLWRIYIVKVIKRQDTSVPRGIHR